ncbi:protein tramtrack, beta isoform-like isoform X2 [Anoplophora glabripennis]|uniref:protein tramtrack, beta isoform-like isoform X2 n=1 Tax=Anoplophora glabripennis TaxID=217634 RepID=UPI000874012F|nr:protein tramtrack, beta isoform-like isoform X2 [Anoplophora glabripennis]
MSGQHYCLRWNNYQSNMTSVFHQLLQNEAFVDVTLACNDLSLKAHKVVLSACSSYFQKLLLENPCKHPTIIMPQDVCYSDLKFIIEFVYKGEIDVSQAELQSILRTADQLKIKGLCESPDDKENSESPLPLYCKGGRKSASPRHFRLADSGNRRAKYRRTSLQERPSDETPGGCREGKAQPGHSSDEENDMPVALDEHKRSRHQPEQTKPLNMSSHGLMTGQFGVDTDDFPPEPPAPSAIPVGHVDMADHSPTRSLLTNTPIHRTDISDSTKYTLDIKKEADIKFETLRSYDQDSLLDMESHMSGPDHSMDSHDDCDRGLHPSMMVQQDFVGMMPGVSNRLDVNSEDQVPGTKNNGHNENLQHTPRSHGGGPKTWTQEDMDMALDALRNHNMSLTKASATYGIPSTTLWQRAHRLGIDTPKKEGPTKSWTEENLNSALEALRTGTISANKASKAYGIPSSTLYKIARREGIRLAAPFNAAPTTWTPEDLEKALESIRTGQTSVQKASTEFGIPTGTLYGRCKREGIELSRSNPTPWSEDAMGEALEAVRLGHMSINQAAIHYNLPYSSLYGRFKRGIKYDSDNIEVNQDSQSQMDAHSFGMDYSTTSHQQIQYHNQNS